MIILGLDPGSRVTGFAVMQGTSHVLTCGVIEIAGDDFLARLKQLGQDVQTILQKYQPDQVAVEKVFLGKNADSAFKLGHARGVLLEKCLAQGSSVFEYSTREIKKTVAGSGGADKTQVATALQMIFQQQLSARLDATDALAVAYHHALISAAHSRGLRAEL